MPTVLRQIEVGPGLDGIMYDEPHDKVILTNHSRPIGTLTAIDPKTGDIVATVELEDTFPRCTTRSGGARPRSPGAGDRRLVHCHQGWRIDPPG